MQEYHVPVLLKASVDALVTDPQGTYADATFGGGGHSREILSRLGSNGRLISFDRDEDALANVPDDRRFTLVSHNFRFMKQFLLYLKSLPVDGILADLGISSHQIDEGERGFAHRLEGPLDMRMDRQSELDAAAVVNNYTEEELLRVFAGWGEIPNARKLAALICEKRRGKRIETSAQLRDAISACTVIRDSRSSKSIMRSIAALSPLIAGNSAKAAALVAVEPATGAADSAGASCPNNAAASPLSAPKCDKA